MQKEETRQERRRRLWDPAEGIASTTLTEGDEYMICEQFFRKINSMKDNKTYRPDIAKDCVLAGLYNFEQFDFYEFANRERCVESLRCKRLRQQAFELLTYVREETQKVERLVEQYHEESDEDKKLVLKELAKIKTSNLKLVEQIRGRIVEIFEKAQDAGDYLDKMDKMIKKDKGGE